MLHDPRLEVRAAGVKGQGVFAREPIPHGAMIVAMQGDVYSTRELTDDLMALQIGPDEWLCSRGTHLDDYINHSCEPNIGFSHGTTVLYALRDIAAGEELAFDYSTSLSEEGWSLACQCGAASCRGVVRAWWALTPAERARLRPFSLNYLRGEPPSPAIS